MRCKTVVTMHFHHDPTITKETVLSIFPLHGSDRFVELIDELVDHCDGLADADVIYAWSHVDQASGDTVIIDGVTFQSELLASCLARKESVVPFVMTLGPETDEALHEASSDVLRQYMLDFMFNLALRETVRAFEEHLREHTDLPYFSKVSPGSLDHWPLQQQDPLFELLSPCGVGNYVRLDRKHIMHPLKSISGIYFPTNIPFSSCILCNKLDCPGRNQPYDPDHIDNYLARI